MHPTQIDYLAASARYAGIAALVAVEAAQLPDLPGEADDEAIAAHCLAYTEIEHRCGYFAAFDDLRRAEDALLEWAHQQVREQPGYRPEIGRVVNSTATHTRIQAIQVALRMTPEPAKTPRKPNP